MQRLSFSTQQPDRDSRGEYVRFSDVQKLIRTIAEAASASTMACHSIVPDSVLEDACEKAGLRFDEISEAL